MLKSDTCYFKKTMNKTGFVSNYIDNFTAIYINEVAYGGKKILELGAGYGSISAEVAKLNNKVVCNDASKSQLKQIEKTLANYTDCTIITGKFPEELSFSSKTFDVIYSSRMLHLLKPSKLISGIDKIYDWLKTGGKAFLIIDTPYLKLLEKFIPIYESKKLTSKFPGFIDNLSLYVTKNYDSLPNSANFLDVPILSRLFKQPKWKIEKIDYIPRPDFPDYLKLDNRESAGIIIKKLNNI